MWRKILLSVGIVILFVAGIEIFNAYKHKNLKNDNQNIVKNETEISTRYVTDDCINEWGDYSKTIENEIKEVGQSLSDENKHYILKKENDLINIYYINENKEEILYRATDISTKYLDEKDVKGLEKGIDAYGIQEVNQILEDYE